MSISRLLRKPNHSGLPRVSFEFFPPKNAEMAMRLRETVARLAPVNPSFVSVTYGAGGTTRERSIEAVQAIATQTGLPVAAHLTCSDASRADVDRVINDYAALGIRHFVALRGDPAAGVGARYVPHPDGYENAAALVAALKARSDFEITVSAYPEKHPESPDFALDIEMLKRKVDNGATRAITQFFFDNDAYLRFLERARAAGISAPIVPGILPVTNFAKVRKFATACGASVPAEMVRLFERLDDDPQTRQLVAATFAAEQCRKLRENGVNEFHFYTLNRAELTRSICHVLGLPARDDGAEREQRAG